MRLTGTRNGEDLDKIDLDKIDRDTGIILSVEII